MVHNMAFAQGCHRSALNRDLVVLQGFSQQNVVATVEFFSHLFYLILNLCIIHGKLDLSVVFFSGEDSLSLECEGFV